MYRDVQYTVKVKDKVSFVHAMNACRGITGVIPLIPNLGTRWKLVVKFTSRPLHPPERTPVPTE
jgi:hypothetical protein